MSELSAAQIVRLEEAERRGLLDRPDDRSQRARKALEAHRVATRGRPTERVGPATYTAGAGFYGGSQAVRLDQFGDRHVSNYLMDHTQEGYEGRGPIGNALAYLDFATTLERNESRADRMRHQMQSDFGETAGRVASALTSEVQEYADIGSNVADTLTFNASQATQGLGASALDALGFDETAQMVRDQREKELTRYDRVATSGPIGTGATFGAAVAPTVSGARAVGAAAKGLSGVPVAGAVGRAVTANNPVSAAARYGIGGAGAFHAQNQLYHGFDQDAARFTAKTPVGDVGAMLGLETAGSGPELQYAFPLLAGAIGGIARGADGTIGDFSRRSQDRAARMVADALDAEGISTGAQAAPAATRRFSADDSGRTSEEIEALAAQAEAQRAVAGAVDPDSVAGLGQRAPEMRVMDLGERSRALAGSASRIGREGADDLKALARAREGDRTSRMHSTFASAIGAPTRAESVIEDTRRLGSDLDARRSELATERGYDRRGVQISDRPVPRDQLDATRNLPDDHTFRDEAAILEDEGERLGLAGRADRMRLAREGSADRMSDIPSGDNFDRLTDNEVKRYLRDRGFATSKLYDDDVPFREVRKKGLRGKGVDMNAGDRKALLARIRDRENAAAPDSDAPQSVSVERLRGMKTAANDEAQRAGQAGERGMASAMKAFADRLRTVLADGVRDASGRRVSLIGDVYHHVLSRAIETLEEAAGVTRDGRSVGPGFFGMRPERAKQMMEDLKRARAGIDNDTKYSTKVRKNILKEFDKAFTAFKQGAARSYLEFLQKNPVSKGARVFNDDNIQMRQRLSVLFDSDDEMNRFLRTVDDEGAMQATEREILYGSQTAARLAEDAKLQGRTDAGAIDFLLTGDFRQLFGRFLSPALQRLGDRYLRGINEQVADEIARLMMRTDFADLARELEAARSANRGVDPANLSARSRNALEEIIRDAEQEAANTRRFSADEDELGDGASEFDAVQPDRQARRDALGRGLPAYGRESVDPDLRASKPLGELTTSDISELDETYARFEMRLGGQIASMSHSRLKNPKRDAGTVDSGDAIVEQLDEFAKEDAIWPRQKDLPVRPKVLDLFRLHQQRRAIERIAQKRINRLALGAEDQVEAIRAQLNEARDRIGQEIAARQATEQDLADMRALATDMDRELRGVEDTLGAAIGGEDLKRYAEEAAGRSLGPRAVSIEEVDNFQAELVQAIAEGQLTSKARIRAMFERIGPDRIIRLARGVADGRDVWEELTHAAIHMRLFSDSEQRLLVRAALKHFDRDVSAVSYGDGFGKEVSSIHRLPDEELISKYVAHLATSRQSASPSFVQRKMGALHRMISAPSAESVAMMFVNGDMRARAQRLLAEDLEAAMDGRPSPIMQRARLLPNLEGRVRQHLEREGADPRYARLIVRQIRGNDAVGAARLLEQALGQREGRPGFAAKGFWHMMLLIALGGAATQDLQEQL